MTLIRPEVTELIWRAREVIWGALVVAAGLWLTFLGGYLLVPVGLAVGGIGLVLATMAFRRMRFAQGVSAPGIVELDEAQVGYLGPETGGFLSLNEVIELRILTLRGRRVWRLKQADGQALLIPVDAAGAERLFDAFSNLPGMEPSALMAALQPQAGSQTARGSLPATAAAEMRLVWRRKGQGVVSAR
jgi:hypothetical protein